MNNKTTYKMEEVYVGELRLDDKVDITDPGYDKDDWCRITTECQPGLYQGYAYISDEGTWGKRVARLSIFKDNKKVELNSMKRIGGIGVDAALAGFFRDKPDYSSQDDWLAFLEKCDVLSNYKKTYAIDYGVFSSSCFGDGVYDVYANEDRSAFTIVFIEENDLDDEDEDYYDEEEDDD